MTETSRPAFVGLHAARGNALAKRMAKPLSSALMTRPLAKPIRYLEGYLAFLQGKGAGTGWDIAEEANAAAACISSPEPVVLDIGANVGKWTEALLARVPRARVFLFEPSPACRAEIARRGLPNAEIVPAAVGAEPGTATLHFSHPTDGTASLHPRRDSYFQEKRYETATVDVVTIDGFLAARGLAFVDFLKMDIEGHELEALMGAREALRRGAIGALSFEFGSGNINSRTFFHDFWDLLTPHGYEISRVTPAGRLLPIPGYYEDLEYFRGVSNYVARLVRSRSRCA